MMGWQWHQLDHMQIIYTSLQTDNHASTSPDVMHGNWTTRGYANSRTANSQTGLLADWSTHGLDNSRTSQLAVWTSRGRDNSQSHRCRQKNEN